MTEDLNFAMTLDLAFYQLAGGPFVAQAENVAEYTMNEEWHVQYLRECEGLLKRGLFLPHRLAYCVLFALSLLRFVRRFFFYGLKTSRKRVFVRGEYPSGGGRH